MDREVKYSIILSTFGIIMLLGTYNMINSIEMPVVHAFIEFEVEDKEYIEPEIEPEIIEDASALTDAGIAQEQEYLPWEPMARDIENIISQAGFPDSPLITYSMTAAEACYTNGMSVDWFCLHAIHESGAGTNPNATSYNAWGWQAYLGSDWETSIWNYTEKYTKLYGAGLNSTNHWIYDPQGSYYKYFS